MRNLRHLSVISVRKNLVSKRTLLSHKQIVHCKVNCDVCGQEIYNSFELKRHKAAVHGIIPAGAFHCENCPLFFRSEKNLRYHIANKH